MSTIKIQQKLNKDDFSELIRQAKAGYVFILRPKNPVTGANAVMMGRVHDGFNLGKKIELRVAMGVEPTKDEALKLVKDENGIWSLRCESTKKETA